MALNKLLTRITTIPELKSLFNEILFNSTSKVSKISKTAVLNGINYAVSKIGQKTMKDVAVIESQIFPEFGTGQYLDNAGRLWVGEERLDETGSSTFIRVKAAPGTIYSPGLHKFIADSGVEFDIVRQTIVGTNGFAYIHIRSISEGFVSNVDPYTINTINPVPVGHIDCTNEYRAIGGRDNETDEVFRDRILSSRNIFSKDTLGFILEVLRLQDPNILRVFNTGIGDDYKINLSVVRVNGAEFTNTELVELEQFLTPYLSLTDSITSYGSGFKLINVEWRFIDIDFRVNILNNFDIDDVRRNIQIALTKLLDFRFLKSRKILWDDMLEVVKNVDGVSIVPVENFNPSTNIDIPESQLPRVRGFIMRNLSGAILFNSANSISPIFYQN